jgi:glycosyltransferase involved in cell wall biosynthesis
MKVVTSCYGRFHIFDQAFQLYRHGALHKLVNDYPKFMTRRWGLPDDKVVSLLANGIYGLFTRKIANMLLPVIQERLTESAHNLFSRRLAKHIPADTDIVIGLSSFSLEAIIHAKENGKIAIMDHGSLHQRLERQLLAEENELWRLSGASPPVPSWIIAKEEAEFQAADRIMVLSQVAKHSMVNEGIPGEKIFVNPCGVNLSDFRPGEKSDNVFRIIQCGGIIPRKGVQYLLQAFCELQLPRAELWFIGGGLEHSSLRSIIQRYRTENVHFKGSIQQNQLYQYYRQGSIFVLASIADGFGLVVPQAMACGLPVIVTENVGAADIVTDGETGFVIPIRDVNSLQQKLLFLYENPTLCRDMGVAALNAVTTGYTWDDYGDRLINFLSALEPLTGTKRQGRP